jgi:aromatic-L-amino-acid decarboxylase
MKPAEMPDFPAASGTSLDPPDWEEFREFAHAALDDAIEFVRSVRERPVWQPLPETAKAVLAEPLPAAPQGVERTYEDLLRLVLPYSVGNVHPRFMGWVHGAGLASGIVAAIMESAMNANCGGRDHCGIYVERTVIDWCKSMFQFPTEARGVLLTGTSMANLAGLAVARNSRACGDLRKAGLQRLSKPLVAYASSEVHESIAKAVEILGVGRAQLRRIPVDAAFRIDLSALCSAVQADRRAGFEPFCVIGTAGTVNVGSVDDLDSLADICSEHELWFHVDGAFGALAFLCPEIRPRLRGIERAHSLAFDFHKWMHIQYDAGCLLVRNGEQLQRTFAIRPDYLQHTARGLAGGGEWPCDLGPELSRGFRALKIWFALKQYGVDAFARSISANCDLVQYLAGLIRCTPGVDLMSPPSLSIVCFRFHPEGWDETELDRLNEAVVADLQECGIAAPSTTRILGALSIRVNITNHRTEKQDVDLMFCSAIKAAHARIASPEHSKCRP